MGKMKKRKSIITNEEKAAQIEEEYTFEARVGAMEMAKWKDQQFKEYLEKKRKANVDNPVVCGIYESIINDFFKETKNT